MSAVEMTLLALSDVLMVFGGFGVIERVARYSSRVLSTVNGLSLTRIEDLIDYKINKKYNFMANSPSD